MVRGDRKYPASRTTGSWSKAHLGGYRIADGDQWRMAWLDQREISLRHLQSLTGLKLGDADSGAEGEALARVWHGPAGDLIRSSAAGMVEIVE